MRILCGASPREDVAGAESHYDLSEEARGAYLQAQPLGLVLFFLWFAAEPAKSTNDLGLWNFSK